MFTIAIRRRPAALLLAATLLAPAACATPTDIERLQDRMERAETLWRSERPVRYEAIERRACECLAEMAGPVRLQVTRRQGAFLPSPHETLVSAVYETSGEPVPETILESFYTAEGLFELIRSAIRDGADSIEAEFDPELGYPRAVTIDVDRQTADEELVYFFELVDAG